MANILRFSVELSSLNGRKEIGSLGKANWFVFSELRPFDETIDLYFSRSNCVGIVKIDTTLNCKDTIILPIKKLSANLVNGQQEAVISIDRGLITITDFYEVVGSITREMDTDEDDSNSTDLKFAKNFCTSSKLLDDLLCMLNNPDSFADATLKCGSVSFLVHRNILSARSPVFAAMFKTQMQEGRDGVVDIVDMEPDVLQAMLKYVYSGKTDHLSNSLARDLLLAADKYQLEELKLFCVETLESGLATNNVFRTLVLGELLDGSLKAHAIDFICKLKTFSVLEKSEEWKTLQSERPALAMEVVMSIVKYLQEK